MPIEFPPHWSPTAREAVENVLNARPDLSGADAAALDQVAELITSAEALEAVARAAGYVAKGSMGQAIAHPCGVEARLARTSAATILARLVDPAQRSAALAARGRAGARSLHGGRR